MNYKVKLKINWDIDSKLDSLEGKTTDPNIDSVHISLLTIRKLFKWRNDLDGLKKNSTNYCKSA